MDLLTLHTGILSPGIKTQNPGYPSEKVMAKFSSPQFELSNTPSLSYTPCWRRQLAKWQCDIQKWTGNFTLCAPPPTSLVISVLGRVDVMFNYVTEDCWLYRAHFIIFSLFMYIYPQCWAAVLLTQIGDRAKVLPKWLWNVLKYVCIYLKNHKR